MTLTADKPKMGLTARPVMEKPRRTFYLGGKDATRSPLYETPHANKDQHQVVQVDGKDCYSIAGRLIGVKVFEPKDKDGSPKKGDDGKAMRKLAIGFDMGDEIGSIVTGLGTNAALSIMTTLAYFYSDKPLPKFLSLTFKRGTKPTVIFASCHASEDAETWESLWADDNHLLLDRTSGMDSADYVETLIAMIATK
jgi:hypothetical protein